MFENNVICNLLGIKYPIFSGAIRDVDGQPSIGETVEVCSARGDRLGKLLALEDRHLRGLALERKADDARIASSYKTFGHRPINIRGEAPPQP